MTVRIDPREEHRLFTSAAVMAGLERVGEQVAVRAASAAPKDTGAGAASIHPEVVNGEVRVSCTPERFYMFFPEVGTSRMPARSFLRSALDGKYDV
jgi:HK97 gp10 family phage protein